MEKKKFFLNFCKKNGVKEKPTGSARIEIKLFL